jgi:hypothetical protein
MAQRKKRTTVAKRKSTGRGKARKSSKPAREKAKRGAAKATPKKGLVKARRAAAKRVARKRARPVKPPSTSAVETATVEVIEEAAPGVVTITEFEETEVREEGEGQEQPKETPRESEEQ